MRPFQMFGLAVEDGSAATQSFADDNTHLLSNETLHISLHSEDTNKKSKDMKGSRRWLRPTVMVSIRGFIICCVQSFSVVAAVICG